MKTLINSDAMKVAANINKKLGGNTVVTANEVRIPDRIPTGSLTLDVVLGWGWVRDGGWVLASNSLARSNSCSEANKFNLAEFGACCTS